MRYESAVWETARLSWIAVAQRTQYLESETFLRTLYLRQTRAYLPSLGTLTNSTECDANCTTGNVVPVKSEVISCSIFYASNAGARWWKGSHSYCCEKFNNVSSASVTPIQRYGVTYGQLACGLDGVMAMQNPPNLQVILRHFE